MDLETSNIFFSGYFGSYLILALKKSISKVRKKAWCLAGVGRKAYGHSNISKVWLPAISDAQYHFCDAMRDERSDFLYRAIGQSLTCRQVRIMNQ